MVRNSKGNSNNLIRVLIGILAVGMVTHITLLFSYDTLPAPVLLRKDPTIVPVSHDQEVVFPFQNSALQHELESVPVFHSQKSRALYDFHHEMGIVHPSSDLNAKCQASFLTPFPNATIGICGSVISESNIYMGVDFACGKSCDTCGQLYKSQFLQNSNANVNAFINPSATVIHAKTLIPILFFWGHAFPHVIKDVLPRLAFVREYLMSHDDTRLLMDKSGPVLRLLEALSIPRNKVLFTKTHTPDPSALFYDTSEYMYHADTVLLPHCWPGPTLTGTYSSQLYQNGRDMLLKGLADSPHSKLNLVIYVSRKGGWSSNKRTIENENELLESLSKGLSGTGTELYKFIGNEHSFQDSLRLFQRAKLVVGPHGGGFYNLIGARPGTKVLELVPHDYGRNEVAKFAAHLDLDYHGFVKEKMKRTQSFGDIDVNWVTTMCLHLLDPDDFMEYPKVPKGFARSG